MSEAQNRLFDFSTQAAVIEEHVGLIRDFADLDPYRSAMVEELVLDEDFYRRPLRPEDLAFLRFRKPVRPETVTLLPSLASQRLLLSINELDIARLPRDGGAEGFERYGRFYGDRARVLGARIRPFLENFAFDHLDRGDSPVRPEDQAAELRDILRTEAGFWDNVFAHIDRNDYLEDGLGFILIQKWCLASTRRIALARAAASGCFEPIGAENAPRLVLDSVEDSVVERLARRCGVTKREHSYWQFYLSTSLASCNLMHALAARPDRALRLYGAAFAAEAEWLAFGCLIGQAAARFDIPHGESLDGEGGFAAALDSLTRRFGRTLAVVGERYGTRGLTEVGQGLAAAKRLGVCVRRDLGEQLEWLSALDRFRDIAHAIDRRIQAERPDIDRETFVEPREMCSTTHVHNDHRLVVIESGDMVFWGNLGMNLRLVPGEMVLVPMGRLHGSSILSDECVYHQPIIPEEWIDPLVADLALRPAARIGL